MLRIALLVNEWSSISQYTVYFNSSDFPRSVPWKQCLLTL